MPAGISIPLYSRGMLIYSRSVLIRILMHDFALAPITMRGRGQRPTPNTRPQTPHAQVAPVTPLTGKQGGQRAQISINGRRETLARCGLSVSEKMRALGGRTRTDSDTRRTLPHIDLTAREGGSQVRASLRIMPRCSERSSERRAPSRRRGARLQAALQRLDELLEPTRRMLHEHLLYA